MAGLMDKIKGMFGGKDADADAVKDVAGDAAEKVDDATTSDADSNAPETQDAAADKP